MQVLDGKTPEMEEKYTYYAFISYKHEDEKWARWIQNKLETYKLPSILQKESRDLPNRITPIFRDKTDITSGPLKKTLSKELEASKFLIVICSPGSAKSIYVDYEVEQFIRMGRQDRIIPLIVGGSVGAQNSDEECYVPSLLGMEETILGVDLPKLGKRKTFLTVIASMLDIKLDTLLHRDRSRRRRKNLLAAAAIAVVMAIGIFTLDYYIPKTYYYSDYVLQWGLPKGIFRLHKGFLFFGDNELKGKSDFYVITESKADKKLTLKHVNSAMVPVDYSSELEQVDRPVIAEYEYKTTDGIKHVASAKYYDRYENVLIVLKYSDDSTIVDFTSGDGSNSPITLSSSLFSENGTQDLSTTDAKSSITRYVYEYDENGYISSVSFRRDNRASTPTPDHNGITGYLCTVDEYGRTITKQMIYNFDNTITNLVFTSIYYYYAYHSPNLDEIAYVDADDNLMMNNDYYAKKLFTYDDKGNLSEIAFCGDDSEWCTNPDGYAKLTILYNENGFTQEIKYYDEKGYPTIPACGYAKEIDVCDKKGNMIEASVYDINGNPMIAMPADTYQYVSGFSIIRREYNNNNKTISESYYDENGEPILCTGEYAKLNIAYDENGRISEISYYDVDGEPKACDMGFEKYTQEYNELGLGINWRYCNADGTLSKTAWGYSRLELEYDDNRNVKAYSFYDENDQPVMTGDNIAHQEQVWDDRGFLIEQRNYDDKGNLVIATSGYAMNVMEYNDSGLCTKDIYYDQNEKLIFVESAGYAEYEATYDKNGNCTDKIYYDANEKLALNGMGYAKYKASYNDKGLISEESYYDADNKLIVPYGYDWARRTAEFSEDGLPVCETYYDAGNNPVVNSSYGYAKCYAEYDQWGNMSSKTFYDSDNKVTVSPVYGYASVKCLYENNKLVRTSYYDAEGNLVVSPVDNYAEMVQQWDENGNLLESGTYDENGKPMVNLYNYAFVEYTYNKEGQETEQRYLDIDRKPTIALNVGYAQADELYNDDGEWEETIYYNQNGEVVKEDQILGKSFVCVTDIIAQSAASVAGVHINDLIMQYGNWCYLPVDEEDDDYALLANELLRVKDLPKTVVVYRASDFSCHSFDFGSGLVGIRVKDITYLFPDENSYKEYITGMEEAYR